MMLTARTEQIPVREQHDIVSVRQVVRSWCLNLGLGLVDLTKLVTAASEIARNTVEYGGGGTLQIEELRDGLRQGVRLVFEDQGPGIPEDKLTAIFDRFYTERPAGEKFGTHSGLGLSISKQIIEAHRGRIWAENRTDADGTVIGARFLIRLPAAP